MKTKNPINKMLYLFSILVSFASCTNPDGKWLSYTDNTNYFSINYPEQWKQNMRGNIVIFASPKDNSKDSFDENVNVVVQDLSKQSVNLEEYTTLTKNQITGMFGETAIVSIKNATIGGLPAKEMIYNMNYNGKELKLKQVWMIKGKVAYLLTYTAEPNKFDTYLEVATKIITSFKLSK